jgi:hypothetical protein
MHKRMLLLLALCTATSRGGAPYRMLEDMADELDGGGSFVEIGSDRGEGSTHWLSSFASRTGRDFFSVDFAPEGFENARRVCGACAHRGLGEEFLAKTFAEVMVPTRWSGAAFCQPWWGCVPWLHSLIQRLKPSRWVWCAGVEVRSDLLCIPR